MAVTLIFCYDQADKDMAATLRKHLSLLERNGRITIWDYSNIIPGSEWEREIKTHLDEAQIILLLISKSFIASDYCSRVEMQRALERHDREEASVIPVILRPVYWQEPPLDKLQALPDNGKPISRWPTLDDGYANVAAGIVRVLEYWDTRGLSAPVAARREALIAQFDQLIEAVKAQMQPPPRALATASTLQQLSIFVPYDVTLADLAVGWRTLAQPQQEHEEPAITQRRVTCGELANMAAHITTEQGNLGQAIKTWHIWQDAFKKSDDPRQAAMAKTFAREVTELQEATI